MITTSDRDRDPADPDVTLTFPLSMWEEITEALRGRPTARQNTRWFRDLIHAHRTMLNRRRKGDAA